METLALVGMSLLFILLLVRFTRSVILRILSWLIFAFVILSIVVVGGSILLSGFVLVFLLFSAVYVISAPVTLIGRFRLPRSSELLPSVNIEARRDELLNAASSNNVVAWANEATDEELRSIKREGKRRFQHGELLFSTSATAILLAPEVMPSWFSFIEGNLPPNVVVTALLGLITLSIFGQVVLLDNLSFSGVGEVPIQDLELAIRWQKATSFAGVFRSLVLTFFVWVLILPESKYEIALDAIEQENIQGLPDRKVTLQLMKRAWTIYWNRRSS